MQNIYIYGMSLYDMLFYFVIYSCIGWIVEVIYVGATEGAFVNRGFLFGPLCPIYGFGALILILVLNRYSHNVLLLFVLSVLLATILEFFVGLMLEKVFSNKWWDYSMEPFNLFGYVCLKISLSWGLGGVILIKIVHPQIEKIISMIPPRTGHIALIVIFSLITIDLIVTIISVGNLNTRLNLITKTGQKILHKSEALGKGLSKDVIELKEKYFLLISGIKFPYKRFFKAFPTITSKKYFEALEAVKTHLSKLKKK